MKVTAAFALPHDHYDWNQGLYQLAMVTRNRLVDNDHENFRKSNIMLTLGESGKLEPTIYHEGGIDYGAMAFSPLINGHEVTNDDE